MGYPLLEENIGRFVCINGTIVEAKGLAGLSLLVPVEDEAVYEVVRVMDGVPLFWEDHQVRLAASIASAGLPYLSPAAMSHEMAILLSALGLLEGNVRIVVTETARVLHQRKHFYPPEETYWTGVPVGAMVWSRVQPDRKALRVDYRKAVAEKLAQEGPAGRYFETLLVSGDGRVTEGGRTNAFFVDRSAGVVRTAPDVEVLLGVTRRHVLEAIRRAGLQVRFEAVAISDVLSGRFEAAFLTGTSIGVLPVSSVEDTQLGSAQNDAVSRIRTEYDRIVVDYIREHRGGLTP